MKTPLHVSIAAVLVAVVTAGVAACTSPPAPEKPAAVAAPSDARSKVTFSLSDTVSVGALQVDIVYASGVGAFAGERDSVECETLVEGALSSYNHLPDTHTLKAAYVAVQGMQGPIAIAECTFQGEPQAADFQIGVLDASTPDLQEIRPLPSVKATVTAAG